jgi:hypothetical protein
MCTESCCERGVEGKESVRVMRGIEWTKVKYAQCRIRQETPLNIALNIYNERQDCKRGTVCMGVPVGGGGGRKEMKVRRYG